MMKTRKLIAVILTAGILILTLSSCKQLDEAKDHVAYWVDDESKTIEWKGRKYILTDVMQDELNIRTAGDVIYVVERDVPVLLSAGQGMGFQTDREERVLRLSYSQHISYYLSSGKFDREIPFNALYIREDLKDSLVKDLENSKMDHYCIDVWTTEKEDSVLLTDELTEKLNKALAEEKALSIDDIYGEGAPEEYGLILNEYDDYITIMSCDRSMFLRGSEINVYFREDYEGRKTVMLEAFSDERENVQYFILEDTSLYDELKKIQFESYNSPEMVGV